MKKIALLLTTFIGFATLQSCTVEEYHNGEYSQVFEQPNETLIQEDTYTYSAIWDFPGSLYDSDNVLVFRWQGGAWTQVPVSYDLGNGDIVKYDYDFTNNDVKVYFSANFPVDQLSNDEYNEFVYRQTFRIVVVPGEYANKADYSDYDTTIKRLGLENAPIKTLTLKK